MPDREYTIAYNVTGNASAAFATLIAQAAQLDAILGSVNAKLQGFGKGSAGPVNALAKSLTRLNAGLAATDKAAAAAAAGLKGAGAEAGNLAPELKAAASASAGFASATASVESSTRGAGAAMGGFIARMAALQAARAAFGAVIDESTRLEEMWARLATEAGEFRESLRELASLRGQPGVNNNVTADVLDLALKSRMHTDKAQEFDAAYENIGPMVRRLRHYKPAKGTPEQLEADVKVETAKTARRLGIDEKAAGEAIGTAGLSHTFTSVEDAMQQFGGAMKGLSEGKVSYTAGVRALSKGANILVDEKAAAAEGATAGRVNNYEEAGVYMGAMSLGTGTADQAQMRMIQVSRLLNPDAKNEAGRAALKQAGVKPDMSDPDKLIRLQEYLRDQKVGDVRGWLSANNLGTESTREKAEGAMKMAPVLKQQLAEVRRGAKTFAAGRKTIGDNKTFAATDRTAQEASVASTADVLDKAEGIQYSEQYEKAKRAAETRIRLLMGPKAYNDPMFTLKRHAMSAVTLPLRGVQGPAHMQEISALGQLKAEAKRVGVDLGKLFPKGELESNDYPVRAEAFTKASDAVTKAGGDPMALWFNERAAGKRVDALRPGVPAQKAGGLPGLGGPQAFNAPGGAGFDPGRLIQINADGNRKLDAQTQLLSSIASSLSGGGGSGASPMGGLPADGGDYSPRRV